MAETVAKVLRHHNYIGRRLGTATNLVQTIAALLLLDIVIIIIILLFTFILDRSA